MCIDSISVIGSVVLVMTLIDIQLSNWSVSHLVNQSVNESADQLASLSFR